MAVVSRIARIDINDPGSTTLSITATAAVQDTPAGASVVVDVAQSAHASPPTSLELSFRIDNTNTIVRTVTLDAAALSQAVTFHFTADGLVAGAARAGTLRLRLHAIRNAGFVASDYNVNSDDSTGQVLPLGWAVLVRDQGFIRGSTTATVGLSNVSTGGGKNSPASYDDSLFHRVTLGAAPYEALSLTHTVGTLLSSADTSNTATVRDVTFASVVDNRWPITSGSQQATVTCPNATLATGLPEIPLTVTTDSMTIDPRLTVSVQAQATDTRTDGANDTLYVISADQLFVWGRTQNARGENSSGVTLTQRVRNGPTVNATDSTKVTAADGWTPPAGVDFTAAVSAPAGNRIHEAFPAAPADAVGLGTGTQTLGFASAYTADKVLALHVPDETPPNEPVAVKVEYLRSDGTRLALDAAPSIRVYSLDGAGAQVNSLAPTTATRIGSAEAWQTTWTPATSGIYIVEARGAFAGGGLEGAEPVKVTPRYVVDPVGLFK